MVVDIGGGTTDIAVMSLSGVLYSRSLRTAGNAMDEAIINYIRHRHNLLIGVSTAESIKVEAGAAIAKANGRTVEIHIKGRDLRKGVPNQIKLEPLDIAEALEPPLALIADGVKLALEQIPPELAADYLRGWHLPHRRGRPSGQDRDQAVAGYWCQIQDTGRPAPLCRDGYRHGSRAGR